MRVYEFSKQHGIPTKELLELLQRQGFNLTSHMSVLTPEALEFLEKKHKKNESSARAQDSKAVETKQAVENVSTQEKDVKEPMKSATPQTKSVAQQPVINKEKSMINSETAQQVHKKRESFTSSVESKKVIPDTLLLEAMTVTDIASALNKPVTELIVMLLKWGILSNKNQLLPIEVVARIAEHYQIKTEKPTQIQTDIKRTGVVSGENVVERLPIVVVVGHVDHGKTTLLDYIRNTRVASREKGGITQHLGAYEAKTNQGNVIFLDTPGHEAFSKMRSRGIKLADLAVLVVAADDSVMPQTVEAVKRIKEIGIPIIVAVNKIDKVDPSRVDVVKRDLAQYDLLPEEWGGDVLFMPISAKIGTGVDQLLEMIVLQSQLMELKADVAGSAAGYVLESRLEKGRGPVATVILQQGTLHLGDHFSCGNTTGKVNSMIDSFGKKLQSIGPAYPIQIAGFDNLPEASDYFEVISKEELRRSKGATERKTGAAALSKKVLIEGAKNLIIKTDTKSSKEALLESIAKVSAKVKKGFNIIHAGVGDITESDITLAADTGSDIYTLHVKCESNAQLLAQRLAVHVATYDVIYKLIETLQEIADASKEIKMVRKKTGEAVVRKVFDIKNVGVIAGCYVKDGIITKDSFAVIMRGKQKVGEGKIASLQRDKKTVKEVHSGFECGFMVEGFTAWDVDDRVELFTLVPSVVK